METLLCVMLVAALGMIWQLSTTVEKIRFEAVKQRRELAVLLTEVDRISQRIAPASSDDLKERYAERSNFRRGLYD